jgi:2-keto-4-pentenoate hydratase/2-oxohepta-3-ene-1,7-dioic acid hydratase in catechol pathway
MVGANYAEPTPETTGQRADRAPGRPYAFLKATEGCIVGSGEAIVRPAGVEQLDWGGELAVVIGRAAKDVPAANALDYVAGYTIVNDVTARERTRRDDVFAYDWYAAKSCDTFAPMGPFLVPRDFVPEPESLRLVTTVSGQVTQDANTNQMVYTVAELIAFLSRAATLAPGDVIATGTPSGVARDRGLFLEPGDAVAVEIEGLGRLENPVV